MVTERRPNTWVARSVIVMRENEGAVIKLKDIIAAVADAFPEEAGRVRRKPNRSGRDPLTGTISRELWDAANGYVPGFEFVKSGGAAFPGATSCRAAPPPSGATRSSWRAGRLPDAAPVSAGMRR